MKNGIFDMSPCPRAGVRFMKTWILPVFLLLALACNPEDENGDSLSPEIICQVRDMGSTQPVPYAQVIVARSYSGSGTSEQTDIVEQLTADANGEVSIHRSDYLEILEENPGSTFFICADGPLNVSVDYYDDNCSSGGTPLYVRIVQNVVCQIPTKAWVRFLVNEDALAQSQYNHLSILQPWIGGTGIGIYPESYDPETGFIQEVYANVNYSFPINFFQISNGIGIPDSTSTINLNASPRDTVTVLVAP